MWKIRYWSLSKFFISDTTCNKWIFYRNGGLEIDFSKYKDYNDLINKTGLNEIEAFKILKINLKDRGFDLDNFT